MFGANFFQFTLVDFVGVLVAVIGIWFVVEQLREAKLASQMEGVLSLTDRFIDISDETTLIDNFMTEDWLNLSPKEALDSFSANDDLVSAYGKVARFYEIVSVLVQTDALDKKIAYKLYGEFVTRRWNNVEKITHEYRREIGVPGSAAEWEWLAKEFENYSG